MVWRVRWEAYRWPFFLCWYMSYLVRNNAPQEHENGSFPARESIQLQLCSPLLHTLMTTRVVNSFRTFIEDQLLICSLFIILNATIDTQQKILNNLFSSQQKITMKSNHSTSRNCQIHNIILNLVTRSWLITKGVHWRAVRLSVACFGNRNIPSACMMAMWVRSVAASRYILLQVGQGRGSWNANLRWYCSVRKFLQWKLHHYC